MCAGELEATDVIASACSDLDCLPFKPYFNILIFTLPSFSSSFYYSFFNPSSLSSALLPPGVWSRYDPSSQSDVLRYVHSNHTSLQPCSAATIPLNSQQRWVFPRARARSSFQFCLPLQYILTCRFVLMVGSQVCTDDAAD